MQQRGPCRAQGKGKGKGKGEDVKACIYWGKGKGKGKEKIRRFKGTHAVVAIFYSFDAGRNGCVGAFGWWITTMALNTGGGDNYRSIAQSHAMLQGEGCKLQKGRIRVEGWVKHKMFVAVLKTVTAVTT